MELRVASLYNDSIVDGPGLRFGIFAQGCPHNCPGCHNPETHAADGGFVMDTEEILAMIKKNPLLSGVTFTGGEPFLQTEPLAGLAEKIRTLGLNIIAYSGFTWEELIQDDRHMSLLRQIDVLIDGKYETGRRNLALKYVGSENQRVIDVQKSLVSGRMTAYYF